MLQFTRPHPSSTHVLRDQIAQTWIIACQEDTLILEQTLVSEGLCPQVLRQAPGEVPPEFARSYGCLLNHAQAWRQVLKVNQPALIVEADFVPVKGFGQLPMPCDVTDDRTGVAWLYGCAMQVYSVTVEGFAEGFSVATVAYVVTPRAAIGLLELADYIRREYGECHYSPWDSQIEGFLRERGLRSYIPFRNYGEHGGIPNPEHAQNRDRWKQLSTFHRADRLYGELAFMPAYATNFWEFRQIRAYSWAKGLTRLFMGKFLRWKIVGQSKVPFRLIGFALRRQGL